jgi:AcrR family transcriptional regulator
MEKFFKIRAEKQEHIINAAFSVFGKQGYKKASVADIAEKAGITKGMITYYFGSKKNLYMYLVDVTIQRIHTTNDAATASSADFFEKLKIVTKTQVVALSEHPGFFRFVNSLYYENDPEVAQDIEKTFQDDVGRFYNILLESSDFSTFKEGVDTAKICKFAVWANDGFLSEFFEAQSETDEMLNEFFDCLDMMKANFYKEQGTC